MLTIIICYLIFKFFNQTNIPKNEELKLEEKTINN